MRKTKSLLLILIGIVAFSITGCRTPALQQEVEVALERSGDDLFIVDCLLPGQVRKLGKMTYMTPRRPIKASAQDCEIRGGEYIAYDRADFRTSLNIWLPMAQSGDVEAQTYVGEIYQKGLDSKPQYDLAFQWFEKAATGGGTRARMNLGFMYEKGLGVGLDMQKALSWYRKAGGLGDIEGQIVSSGSAEKSVEFKRLQREVESYRSERQEYQEKLLLALDELKTNRQEVAYQREVFDKNKTALAQVRRELTKKQKQSSSEVEKEQVVLKQRLKDREATLDERQQALLELQRKVEDKSKQISTYSEKLGEYEKKFASLPKPLIKIVSPQVTFRGNGRVGYLTSEGAHKISGQVWAPAGLSVLRVNGKGSEVDADGKFTATLPILKEDHVNVIVEAIDERGISASTTFRLVEKIADVSGKAKTTVNFSQIDFGSYHALIIGNDQYRHLPKLNTAVNDARSLAEILQSKYDYSTTLLLDVDRYEILKALNGYRKNLTDKDNLLIYYAGHGELDTKNQRGYWLPVDAERDSNVNWIPSYAITDILNNMSAKQVIVVADTCYSGILTRSGIANLQPGMSDEVRFNFLNAMTKKRSRMVLSSGELKPVLDAGGGEHSVFAKAFLDVLNANGEILEGWNLYNRVSKIVTYASEQMGYQQVPQYSALIRGGHESGGFFFVPDKT